MNDKKDACVGQFLTDICYTRAELTDWCNVSTANGSICINLLGPFHKVDVAEIGSHEDERTTHAHTPDLNPSVCLVCDMLCITGDVNGMKTYID